MLSVTNVLEGWQGHVRSHVNLVNVGSNVRQRVGTLVKMLSVTNVLELILSLNVNTPNALS